jgi:hypothetical protein
VPEPHLRAPHIVSLTFEGGLPAGPRRGTGQRRRLCSAAPWGACACHRTCTMTRPDIDRFVEVLTRRLRG